jgi:hypothetical protein
MLLSNWLRSLVAFLTSRSVAIDRMSAQSQTEAQAASWDLVSRGEASTYLSLPPDPSLQQHPAPTVISLLLAISKSRLPLSSPFFLFLSSETPVPVPVLVVVAALDHAYLRVRLSYWTMQEGQKT